MKKFGKRALWIVGGFLVLVALFLALVVWVFVEFPTHDQALLKAINVESRILMAKKMTTTTVWSEGGNYDFGNGSIGVAKSQWSRAIASLSPQYVSVDRGRGVDILTRGFFDGGWGYWVQPGIRKPPVPVERFEYLGEDVYFYHPY